MRKADGLLVGLHQAGEGAHPEGLAGVMGGLFATLTGCGHFWGKEASALPHVYVHQDVLNVYRYVCASGCTAVVEVVVVVVVVYNRIGRNRSIRSSRGCVRRCCSR